MHLFAVILAAFYLLQGTLPAQEEYIIHIVFDASARMAEEVDGRSKISLGIECVEELLEADIPASFALTVFGSDETAGPDAYYSPVPPGRNNRTRIINELQQLNAEGSSPIASTLLHASQSYSRNTVNYVLLITDGVENTGDALLRLVWMFPTDTWAEIEYLYDAAASQE